MGLLLFSYLGRSNIIYSMGDNAYYNLFSSGAKHKYTLSMKLSESHVFALCLEKVMYHSHKVRVMQPKGELSLQSFIHLSLPFWANAEDFSAQCLKLICKLILSFFIVLALTVEVAYQWTKTLTCMKGSALSVPYNSKWNWCLNRIPLHLTHRHWYNPW